MIEKKFDKSLELINEINNLQTCTANGISFVENRNVEIRKTKQNISLTFSSPFSEYSTIHSAIFRKLEQINIQTNLKEYIIPAGGLITQHKDLMSDAQTCTISSQSIYSTQINLQKKYYYRCFIPIDKDDLSFRDYSFYPYQYNNNGQCYNAILDLIKITVNDKEYHFWILKRKNQQSYLVIDTMDECSFETIEKISLDIIVAYGFLCGTIYLDEMYFVAGNNNDFTDLQGIYYKALRNTIKGRYTIFTTNSYSVLCHIGKVSDAKEGESKAIQKINDEKWTEKLQHLPEKVFSKLVQEIHESDAVLRSAMTIVEASKFPVDIQFAVYCVALETISNHIVEKFNKEFFIEQSIWENQIKPQFISLINELGPSDVLNETQISIAKKKIESFNRQTNQDKLKLPFVTLGYVLSNEEEKCLRYRNTALHGNLPIKKEENEFDKLSYVNLMFHKLCSILILKLVGFDGYIINNVKLHEKNIKRTINEEGFLKI